MLVNSIINKLDNIYNKKDYRSNIIYITTRCNYYCEFCFVFNSKSISRKVYNECSTKDIDDFLEEINKREWDLSGKCITVMGGEPFLAFDKLKYLFEKAKNTFNSKYSTSILIFTNSSFFGNEKNIIKYKELVEYYNDFNININISVSYEGSGQSARHKNTEYSKKLLDKLYKNNINFSFSYTISELNYKVWKDDLNSLIKEYDKQFRINVDQETLEKLYGDFNINKLRQEINNFNKDYVILDGVDQDNLPKGYTNNRIYKLPQQELLNISTRSKDFNFDKINRTYSL